MAATETFKQDYRWFIETGLVAINQCDEDAALKLFEAAKVLRPEALEWQMGMGLIHLNKMELDKAVVIFQKLLTKDPGYHTARAFLGFALGMISAMTKQYSHMLPKLGDKFPKGMDIGKKAIELLTEAKKKATDPAIKEFANSSLEWFTKGIKKPITPSAV